MINSTQLQQLENSIVSCHIDAWLSLLSWIESQEVDREELYAYFCKALEQWICARTSNLVTALVTAKDSEIPFIVGQLKCLNHILYNINHFRLSR